MKQKEVFIFFLRDDFKIQQKKKKNKVNYYTKNFQFKYRNERIERDGERELSKFLKEIKK
jgi:hypothetical protein